MFNLKGMWLGDEASLREMLSVEQRAIGTPVASIQANTSQMQPGQEALPRLYSRKNGIGIVTIRGGLVNTENAFTRYFEMGTYPAIREALIFGASDPQVQEILLDIESPGGQVSGTNDTAKLVKQIDKVKPVTAFSDSLVASAAYWIASGARKLYVGETSIVGSIGVIATQMNYSKALEKEGVQVIVVRAGKNKALGHPAEPVSDKAVAQIQERVDALYEVFTATVSANRPKLKPSERSTWAEGNEFLGGDAVSESLADGVSDFDTVFAKLVQNLDGSGATNKNVVTRTRGAIQMPRAVLDPKIVAAIEAGAQLTQEQEAIVAAATAEEVAVPSTDVPAAEEGAAAVAADKPKGEAAAAVVEAPANVEVVAYLEQSVKDKSAEILALSVELATLKAKSADMEASHPALMEIAGNSVSKMNIALGKSAITVTGLTATAVIEMHKGLSADFQKAFKVDGVAVTAPETAEKKVVASTPAAPLHRAKIASVRLVPAKS